MVVKCQAAGCVPVTTRIAALNETVHPFAPCIPIIKSPEDILKYKDTLLTVLRCIRDDDPKDIAAERQRYIEFAHKFSWAACVDKWLELYTQVTA